MSDDKLRFRADRNSQGWAIFIDQKFGSSRLGFDGANWSTGMPKRYRTLSDAMTGARVDGDVIVAGKPDGAVLRNAVELLESQYPYAHEAGDGDAYRAAIAALQWARGVIDRNTPPFLQALINQVSP